MSVKEIATIAFSEGDSGKEAVAIIRQCGNRLAVAVSVRDNGDVEVLLDADTAVRLADAIKLGIEMIVSAEP